MVCVPSVDSRRASDLHDACGVVARGNAELQISQVKVKSKLSTQFIFRTRESNSPSFFLNCCCSCFFFIPVPIPFSQVWIQIRRYQNLRLRPHDLFTCRFNILVNLYKCILALFSDEVWFWNPACCNQGWLTWAMRPFVLTQRSATKQQTELLVRRSVQPNKCIECRKHDAALV